MKISACVITKNEGNNIERSIRSYQNIADEIIVVDSGSTDDTVKIAEGLGAVVYHRDWTNDFAAAKNYAIEKATGDWILFLDGDEYFADGDSEVAYKFILQAESKGVESIFSPRYELYEVDGPVQGISYVERIFKNDPSIRYSNKIHECLQNKGNALKQIQTYLAESYNSLQRYEDAICECDKLMALPEFKEVLFTTQKVFHVYIIKTTCMLALSEKYEECEIQKTIEEGVFNFGKHPEVRYVRSVFYQHYGYIDKAISDFEKALVLNKNYNFQYENVFDGAISVKYLNAANLYKIKNVPEKVIECLIEVLRRNPGNEDALWELLKQMEGKKTEEKQAVIESLYDIGRLDNITRVTQAAWLSGCNDLFAIYFLSLINRWPSELTRDQSILCKVFLLQKNYEGILLITAQHPGEELYRRFEIIAMLARGASEVCHVDRIIDEGMFDWNYGFAFAVITELLQAHEYGLIDLIIASQAMDRIDALKHVAGKCNLAAVFERFQRWQPALKLYLDAGRLAASQDAAGEGAKSQDAAGKGAKSQDAAGGGAKSQDAAGEGAKSQDAAGEGAKCQDAAGEGAKSQDAAGGGAKSQDAAGGGAKSQDAAGEGALLLAAAKMAYYAGDFEMCADILEEGLPFAKKQDHMPEQILKWMEKNAQNPEKSLRKRIKKLQKSYERALMA